VWDESNAQIALNTGASTDWKMTHYFTTYSWDSGHSWPFPRQNYLEISIASLSVLLICDWTDWLCRYSNFVMVMIPRVHYYHWVDNTTGGLLVLEGTSAQQSVFGTDMVIIIKTKIFLAQSYATFSEFRNTFRSLSFLAPKDY